MKHYAGLDLSMETTHVCVVDAEGRKIGAQCVDSTPEAIATALEHYGPIERAVIETGRMTPSIALGLRELGVAIVCIDARQAHQSLKAMKANTTDPHDAAGLAQLAWRSWRARGSARRYSSSRRRHTACARSLPPAGIWSRRASGSTTPSVVSEPPSELGSASARASGSSRGCRWLPLSRVSAKRSRRCSAPASASTSRSGSWIVN